MTQKEKARAYDEALERARALRQEAIDKGYAIDYVKDYEAIFPELAESEEERIRKELIEAFEVYDIESSWNLIPVKHILAWLEKQREQKPAEWSEEDENARQNLIAHFEGKVLRLSDEAKKEAVDWLKSLRPSWKPSKEQDYSDLSDLERAIHRGFLCAGVENVPRGIIEDTAKEVLVYAKKQLLSYADESNPAIEAMADLERTYFCNPDKLPKWLKDDIARKEESK